jgi:hypothetical protein
MGDYLVETTFERAIAFAADKFSREDFPFDIAISCEMKSVFNDIQDSGQFLNLCLHRDGARRIAFGASFPQSRWESGDLDKMASLFEQLNSSDWEVQEERKRVLFVMKMRGFNANKYLPPGGGARVSEFISSSLNHFCTIADITSDHPCHIRVDTDFGDKDPRYSKMNDEELFQFLGGSKIQGFFEEKATVPAAETVPLPQNDANVVTAEKSEVPMSERIEILEKLLKLKEAGALTEEEFNEQKRKVLGK